MQTGFNPYRYATNPVKSTLIVYGFRVSIPYRYATNYNPQYTRGTIYMFQFLIGTLQTCCLRSCWVGCENVSIPYRYATNLH